jgi:hypothetical protein
MTDRPTQNLSLGYQAASVAPIRTKAYPSVALATAAWGTPR